MAGSTCLDEVERVVARTRECGPAEHGQRE